ncbi:replicative DNA helicase [Limosilactobacillus sp.]|uniref:replicative DNA helicase n=1 Tax=Limosilactobacillus sp. TaxID=2773925 RepID=UPI00345E8FE9
MADEQLTTAGSSAPQMPNDQEAERAVLGSAFLSDDAFKQSLEFLTPKDFYQRNHQIMYQAMVNLDDRDEKIDPITIRDELTRENQLANVGGIKYVAELAGAVPTAANVEYYAKIVRDKATARRLIEAAQNIIDQSYEGKEAVADLTDNAEQSIMQVAEDQNTGGFQNMNDLVDSSLNHIEELTKDHSDVTGISTGYKQLDEITTGLHPDEFIVIAARPAMGKTAFALNLAQNVAIRGENTVVAIFSLEMGAESLVDRMLCAEGRINSQHLRTGNLTNEEVTNLWNVSGTLANTRMFIDDTPGIKVSEIRAKCRRLKKEQGSLSLIVIDYLQLIEGGNAENRQQEVSMISRQLKKLAKELSVPVIALSQLSRGVEQRQDKRPVLSDIRESGSIEQDADIVSFLYRDDYYDRDDNEEDPDEGGQPADEDDQPSVSQVELIIEKNRSGPRGTVNLMFNKTCNKFVPQDLGRSIEENQQ